MKLFTKKKLHIDGTETGDFYGHAGDLANDADFQAALKTLNAVCSSAEVELTIHPINPLIPLDEEAIRAAVLLHGSQEQCDTRARIKEAQIYNAPIKAEISRLDARRLRPLAEGETERLNALTAQIVALRSTLRKEE